MITLEDLEEGLFPTIEQVHKGPSELEPYTRKYAINIVSREYVAKFPIEYFYENKDKKHDRIIAEITVGGKYKKKEIDNYMFALVKKINKKQNKLTFIYRKNYLFANPVEDKKISNESLSPSNMPPVSESSVNNLMEFDMSGSFTLEELTVIPMVKHYQNNGLDLKQSVSLMEARMIANPFMPMLLVNESCFNTPDEYDNFLIESFIDGFRRCGFNQEIAAEALSTFLFADSTTPTSIKATTEAIDRHRGALHKISHEIGRKVDAAKSEVSPYVQRIKRLYDETMGEEAVKEEIIKGGITGWLIRWRRLFLKLIIVWKSAGLISLAAGAAGSIVGFPWGFIISGIALFGRLHVYLNQVKAGLGFTDNDREDAKKQIINELELELKITREKIEDARSAGDTKARYELIRIEHKIEKELYRIRYNKSPEAFRGEQSIFDK